MNFQRISTQRWISINAIVFLITILGICIAMSHFQIQPPENSASNSTPPVHSSLFTPEFGNSTFGKLNSTIVNDPTGKNTTIIDDSLIKNATSIKPDESDETSMEDSMETSAEENVNAFGAEVESVPTPEVIPKRNSDSDENDDAAHPQSPFGRGKSLFC